MRKLMLLAFMIVIGLSSQAQSDNERSGITFSVGAEPAIPVGLFRTVSSFVIGGSVQGEKHLTSDLGLTLLAGYNSLQFKSYSTDDGNGGTIKTGGGSSGMVPVLAGLKYYVKPNVFGHAQLGIAFSTQSGGGSNFTYSPGIGMNITQQLDAELKYTSVSTGSGIPFGTLGLRVAYNF